jgi:3-hydroxypropionyl-coenzyme A dehydratase
MVSASEAEQIGLVNKVIDLGPDDVLPPDAPKGDPAKEKERSGQVAGLLNRKLMEECLSMARQITKNSFNAIKTSKMLLNKAMDADIATGLRLEIYGWALCFAHEDREKMMSAFLNKGKK